MRPLRTLVVLATAAGMLAACGDDAPKLDGDVAAWCAMYEVISEVDPAEADPAKLEANLQEWTDSFASVRTSSPSEIRDETNVLADKFKGYVAQAQAANYDISKVDVDGFFSEDAKVTEASEAVDDFSEKHCDS